MRVGFTGTQRGMTAQQKVSLLTWLANRRGEFHHGDCIGADAEAHDIAEGLFWTPIIHPPSNPSKRAWKKAPDIRKPKPYIERNHDIVDETEELIATPGEDTEQLRSGTWATVRYARKQRRMVTIILPDGSFLLTP